MANLLQFQNQSQLIASKARAVLLSIKQQYETGQIKTQTEYLYKLYQAMQGLMNGIDQPSLQVRYADGPPFSKDYNDMVQEIHADLQLLFSETNDIGSALQESFNQIEIDRQAMSNRLKRIEDSMNEIDLKLHQAPQEIIFRDSFIDQQFFDKEMTEDAPANLATSEGILTLKPTSSDNYLSGATIRIVEGNGFPGNTHQVRSVAGELRFVGEDNLHLNLAEILDGNADTWFEYEIFDVPKEEQDRAARFGFEYYEGIKWIADGAGVLRLQIEIELPFTQVVNWFSINPFIPNDKGALPCQVKSVTVHDGKGRVTEILTEDSTLSEEKVMMFSPQRTKRIVIQLEQPSPYETVIGHLFHKELEKQNANFLDRNQQKNGKRIAGTYPSIENLGVKYNAETKRIDYITAREQEQTTGVEGRKHSLFTAPAAGERIQTGFEELAGWRYVIGLRDIQLANYRFEPASEYRSTAFVTNAPLYGVSLAVNSSVPKEFAAGDWLQYFISVDNGQNWLRIAPTGTIPDQGKTMYLFNTNTPPEGRIPYFGYLDPAKPVYSVRVKILLSRPTYLEGQDAECYTPIVQEYKLHVITSGEGIK